MSTVSEALSALGRVKSGLFAASAVRVYANVPVVVSPR